MALAIGLPATVVLEERHCPAEGRYVWACQGSHPVRKSGCTLTGMGSFMPGKRRDREQATAAIVSNSRSYS